MAPEHTRRFQSAQMTLDEWPQPSKYEPRIIQDNVHGQIALHYPLEAVVDTLPFQRLRDLKQTGFAYTVYPNGTHNRFTHCLGTYHLANRMVEKLMSIHGELHITSADRLCVAVAALCHDLGHGPFSHTFDGVFREKVGGTWSHERLTVRLLDRIFNGDNVRQKFAAYLGEDSDEFNKNLLFIKELIVSKKHERFCDGRWVAKGRGQEKSFLYDIVSNENDGFDVDKYDYLLRDSNETKVAISLDLNCINRIIEHSRVMLDPDTRLLRICFAEKIRDTLNAVGQARQDMHVKVYNHKTVLIVEEMAVEAMVLANDELTFVGDNGNIYRLSETVNDMGAYIRTNDSVISTISNSVSPKTEKAREIIDKIYMRKLPKLLDQFVLSPEKIEEIIKRENGFVRMVDGRPKLESVIRSKLENELCDVYNANDFVMASRAHHRGRGQRQPMAEVLVYDSKFKNEPPKKVDQDWINVKVPASQAMYFYVYIRPDVIPEKRSKYAEALQKVKQSCGLSSRHSSPTTSQSHL